jgi:SAM-dependent methyltransferase
MNLTQRALDRHGLRPDLAAIADWIAPGSRVLDLGCGDGALLDHLQHAKGCSGYGVEIDDALLNGAEEAGELLPVPGQLAFERSAALGNRGVLS